MPSKSGCCLQVLLSIQCALKLLGVTEQPKARSPLIGASLRDMQSLGGGLFIARGACLYLNFEVFTCCG